MAGPVDKFLESSGLPPQGGVSSSTNRSLPVSPLSAAAAAADPASLSSSSVRMISPIPIPLSRKEEKERLKNILNEIQSELIKEIKTDPTLNQKEKNTSYG